MGINTKSPLPIDRHLPEIESALASASSLILQATPGSGKTTRVPPYLLEKGYCPEGGQILVLVPRRLAAKMAALRVAEERGEAVGATVGYQFRFENQSGPKTRLKFLTEGMLLRYLVQDPLLRRVSLVVLDEFHERHLHSDVALGYLRRLQTRERPDLKLLVMSATLEAEGLSSFLGGAPVLRFEAPAYPVAIEYQPSEATKPLERKIKDAVASVLAKGGAKAPGYGENRELVARGFSPASPGDILVFLPGMGEILRSAEALRQALGGEARILPLHGELPKEEQAKVFAPADRRKIILATNVAETSLTIEGVTTVIDTGLHRQASYSWWSGIPALKTKAISRASGTQRAGRAGRTAPGTCLRLYSKSDWDSRLAFETPEIRRSDLAQTLLEIKAMGVERLSEFSWLENPPEGGLQAAAELLFLLGTTEGKGLDAALTPLGRRLAELPLHPRLGRFLLAAEAKGVLAPAFDLAAAIAEQDLDAGELHLFRPSSKISEGARRSAKQFAAFFPKAERARGGEDELAYALLCGFPDRVAKLRPKGRGEAPELVFCAGGSGAIPTEFVLGSSEYFLVLDVQERQGHGQSRGRVHVRSLVSIEPEWLFDWQGSLLQESQELVWEAKSGKVQEVQRLSYGQLLIEESRKPAAGSPEASLVFWREGLGLDLEDSSLIWNVPNLLEKLRPKLDVEALESLFSRLAWMKKAYGEVELPDWEGEGLKEGLKRLFSHWRMEEGLSVEALENAAWDAFGTHLQGKLQRLLPTGFALPSGRRARVHYPWGREPWLESRMQDFFGLKQAPQLAEGRVPLVVHLLAPNGRAVQVTRDLAGFWRNTYPSVRLELKRRYPKHAWPEDPLRGKT